MRLVHLLRVSRLEGLTDGIFAIAMTILILDLRIPANFISPTQIHLWETDILYKLLIYGGSFIILGTQWVAMNFQWGLLQRLNRPYLWTNIFYLMIVCIIPFSANLVGSYPNSVTSIYFYAANLLSATIFQVIIFSCSHYFKLNNTSYTPAIARAIVRRIALAPIFYITAMITASWATYYAFILLIAPTAIYIFPGVIDRYEAIGSTRNSPFKKDKNSRNF